MRADWQVLVRVYGGRYATAMADAEEPVHAGWAIARREAPRPDWRLLGGVHRRSALAKADRQYWGHASLRRRGTCRRWRRPWPVRCAPLGSGLASAK